MSPGRQQSGRAEQAAAQLFQQAAQDFGAGRLEPAERACRRILVDFPDNGSTLNLLGLVVWRAGRLADARGLLERALVQNPKDADAHNNLGCVLLEDGKPAEALVAIDAALKLRPAYPEALANRARVLLALDRPEEAHDSSSRALALRPNYFDALTHLGNAALALGRTKQAGKAFGQAVALAPNHAGAHVNLGRAAQEHGALLEAETEFRQAIALAPQATDARLALGGILDRSERFDEARTVFQDGLRLAPGDLMFLLGLAQAQSALRDPEAAVTFAEARKRFPQDAAVPRGIALSHIVAGRREPAIAALNEALTLDPDHTSAMIALVDFLDGDARKAMVERIDRSLQGGAAIAPKERISTLFTLGRALLEQGEPARAFAALDEGNRLHRARLDFDIALHEKHMEDVAQQFTPALFERLQGAGVASDLPIFVLGMPRSGTTLVEQILASHPDIQGAGELSTIHRATHGLSYPDCMADADARLVDRIGQFYLDDVAPLAQGRARLVDKMPSNFSKAGLIALMLPGARIIHCRRDPVETCLSCYMTHFVESQPFCYDQTELGRYWRAYDTLMAHWRSVLPPERFLEVHYEDVVADLEGQARRLIAFAGLSWTEACLDFHKTERTVRTASVNQVRQPIYKRSVDRWRRHAAYLRPLLDALGISEPTGSDSAPATR